MSTLEPKHELVVFHKKEIAIVLLLFLLVALFSFTLGVRMGRTLTDTKLYREPHQNESALAAEAGRPQEAPLSEKTGHDEAVPDEHGVAKAVKDGESGKISEAKPEAKPEEKPEEKKDEAGAAADDSADQELHGELAKTGIKTDRPVSMTIPTKKRAEAQLEKGIALGAGRYTLQVGSHRTVSEAADQVMGLKRKGLDAFYLEADLPGKGTWYRVGVGNFPSKELAEQYAARFKNELPPYIVQKVVE